MNLTDDELSVAIMGLISIQMGIKSNKELPGIKKDPTRKQMLPDIDSALRKLTFEMVKRDNDPNNQSHE